MNIHVTKPTVVYAFEFWVSQYYTNNTNVSYEDSVNPEQWSNKLCTHPQDVYIIIDNQAERPVQYFDQINGLNFFIKIKESPRLMHNLHLLTTINAKNSWAKIYRLEKKQGYLCSGGWY
jgi:hypothetical protein